MTDTAAAFDSVIPFPGRVASLGAYGRIVANHAALCLTAVATVAALMAVVVFASSWVVNITLSGNNRITGSEWNGPRSLALVTEYPRLPIARTASHLTPLQAAPSVGMTFETRWKQAMSSTSVAKSVRTARIHPQGFSGRLILPQAYKTMPEIPPVPAAIHIAGLSAAVAPTIEPPRALPVAPRIADAVPLPRPYPATRRFAGVPATDTARQVASLPARSVEQPQRHTLKRLVALPSLDNHTAVYDIAAHTVYLPNGERLEAHSGLGHEIDDPRYIHVKNRGPTPPNVYELSLREQLFHGVRAIRLTPVAGSQMFGRDGMLAHTYMLGPNGQSNGCVSFRNYQAFLHAYLRGEIDRLLVVPHIGRVPPRLAKALQSSGTQDERYAANIPRATSTVITW